MAPNHLADGSAGLCAAEFGRGKKPDWIVTFGHRQATGIPAHREVVMSREALIATPIQRPEPGHYPSRGAVFEKMRVVRGRRSQHREPCTDTFRHWPQQVDCLTRPPQRGRASTTDWATKIRPAMLFGRLTSGASRIRFP